MLLKRHLLAILAVIFTLSCFSISTVSASKHEAQEIVNFNGRLVPKSLVDRYNSYSNEEGGLVRKASFAAPDDLLGENFAVSTADGDQYASSVAYNPNSNDYLVILVDNREQSHTGADVHGKFVSPTGDLKGDNFVITNAPGDQLMPELAYNSTDNEYLVIWYDDQNVYGQRLSDAGALLGSERVISASSDVRSSIAYNSRDNTYLVASPVGDWREWAMDIRGQLLSNEGVRRGSSFSICRERYNQGDPVVAYNSVDNEYMIVWTDFRHSIPILDIFQMDVYGQLISSTGQPIGGNFPISSIEGIDWEASPHVVHNSDLNEYMVVWWDDRDWPDEGNIYGRLLRGNSSPIGDSFPISLARQHQDWPHVSYSSTGTEYLVAWTDERNESVDIYAQRVDSDTGTLEGGSIPISTARYIQAFPEAAYNEDGGQYLVVSK